MLVPVLSLKKRLAARVPPLRLTMALPAADPPMRKKFGEVTSEVASTVRVPVVSLRAISSSPPNEKVELTRTRVPFPPMPRLV